MNFAKAVNHLVKQLVLNSLLAALMNNNPLKKTKTTKNRIEFYLF